MPKRWRSNGFKEGRELKKTQQAIDEDAARIVAKRREDQEAQRRLDQDLKRKSGYRCSSWAAWLATSHDN